MEENTDEFIFDDSDKELINSTDEETNDCHEKERDDEYLSLIKETSERQKALKVVGEENLNVFFESSNGQNKKLATEVIKSLREPMEVAEYYLEGKMVDVSPSTSPSCMKGTTRVEF